MVAIDLELKEEKIMNTPIECDFYDLVMDNGELVRIFVPKKFTDDFNESISDAMKRGDWWSPSRFDGCTATYMGLGMDRVNMKRVVGMLP